MDRQDGIFLGAGAGGVEPQYLSLAYANRHGLVTGATGTGKTVSLQSMAEGFSRAGVPVFMADVKGDLSGLAAAGAMKDGLVRRAADIGLADYAPAAVPAIFWDLLGEQGHPVRTTVSEMGPLLLARILELNDVQEGVLNVAFRYADDEGLLLLDLKDLRALLQHVADHAKEIGAKYGLVSAATINAVQRGLLALESQGASSFFGEPALDLRDLMRVDHQGRGIVSILAADKLMMTPKLYATFLLWLLAELFEELPEAGDMDRPKLVFFFDEAHLLFDGAPKALVDKVEQVVRLIRSKGVGVYFVTQSPLDVPEDILGQLGNRVQHALRAFTPKDQKAVRAAAETFRPNPAFDCAEAITQLGVGEALVSTLEAKGIPSMVARTLMRPPTSRLGPLTNEERRAIMTASPVAGVYDQTRDRHSAYEALTEADAAEAAPAAPPPAPRPGGSGIPASGIPASTPRPAPPKTPPAPRASNRQTVTEAAVKSAVRSIATTFGREIVRGILGSFSRRR